MQTHTLEFNKHISWLCILYSPVPRPYIVDTPLYVNEVQVYEITFTPGPSGLDNRWLQPGIAVLGRPGRYRTASQSIEHPFFASARPPHPVTVKGTVMMPLYPASIDSLH